MFFKLRADNNKKNYEKIEFEIKMKIPVNSAMSMCVCVCLWKREWERTGGERQNVINSSETNEKIIFLEFFFSAFLIGNQIIRRLNDYKWS